MEDAKARMTVMGRSAAAERRREERPTSLVAG
jgi:hypothetical protein